MHKNVTQLADSRDGVAENTWQEAHLCLKPLEGVLECFRGFRRPHITVVSRISSTNCGRELRKAALWGWKKVSDARARSSTCS